MSEFNFRHYSLVLIKDNKEIFESKEPRLKPLVECIAKFKSKEKNCTLYDKVIGLAAAKLIVYSGMISEVITPLCSADAGEFLIKNNITLKTDNMVDNIYNEDKTDICPMEKKAIELKTDSEFIEFIKNTFNCDI